MQLFWGCDRVIFLASSFSQKNASMEELAASLGDSLAKYSKNKIESYALFDSLEKNFSNFAV